jgi:hypothetical protein
MILNSKLFDLPSYEIKSFGLVNLTYGSLTNKGLKTMVNTIKKYSYNNIYGLDLGCGDGGLLQLLKESNVPSWGYDLMPNNIEHAVNVRGVDARFTNFISDDIEYADVAVMTETLEHMEDPHQVVRDLPSKYLIASSPYNESDQSHYEFHLWAWDSDGYDELIRQGGYTILEKGFVSGWSQVVLAARLDA